MLAASAASPLCGQTKKAEALTGCLDEQADSQYVLRDQQQLQLLAILEAEGFKNEIFAQYVGHKVTVEGARAAKGTGTVFRVRRITRVAPTCAPEQAAAPELVARNVTATGCVDEQPGPKYVLLGEERRFVLELEAESSDTESFARYLGRRVTAHGDKHRTGSGELMKVRKIERLEGRCRTPEQ